MGLEPEPARLYTRAGPERGLGGEYTARGVFSHAEQVEPPPVRRYVLVEALARAVAGSLFASL